jgi:hypothetical protein
MHFTYIHISGLVRREHKTGTLEEERKKRNNNTNKTMTT